jgi:hypothetical protein
MEEDLKLISKLQDKKDKEEHTQEEDMTHKDNMEDNKDLITEVEDKEEEDNQDHNKEIEFKNKCNLIK